MNDKPVEKHSRPPKCLAIVGSVGHRWIGRPRQEGDVGSSPTTALECIAAIIEAEREEEPHA
jgi:hypothetical protein